MPAACDEQVSSWAVNAFDRLRNRVDLTCIFGSVDTRQLEYGISYQCPEQNILYAILLGIGICCLQINHCSLEILY